VRRKQKAAVLSEQRLALDRIEAYYDARALAFELACGEPSVWIDPMRAGVVLQPGEIVYRQVPVWIRVQERGRWAEASCAEVLATDKRLLCRFASGRLTSLWWSGVVGLDVDLPLVAPVAVVAIASLYGMEAILTHHALATLRTKSFCT
jgi:hypothetical protein